jgi:hypothetical protein
MVAVPPDTPVTTPVVASTDAREGALLLQVPPLGPLESVVVEPTQIAEEPPAMAEGGAETVNSIVVVPDGPVNVIVAVPAAWPVTTAVAPETTATVATAVLLLLHEVPTPVESTVL